MTTRFRHKIKCIEKRSFLTMVGVREQIVRNWVNNHNALGWYECSQCLAFHLTKRRGDMRDSTLKKVCRQKFLQRYFPKRKPAKTLIFERMEAMHRFITAQNKKNRISKQERKERRDRWKENGWTKKNSTLPLEEQRRLLNKLHTQ